MPLTKYKENIEEVKPAYLSSLWACNPGPALGVHSLRNGRQARRHLQAAMNTTYPRKPGVSSCTHCNRQHHLDLLLCMVVKAPARTAELPEQTRTDQQLCTLLLLLLLHLPQSGCNDPTMPAVNGTYPYCPSPGSHLSQAWVRFSPCAEAALQDAEEASLLTRQHQHCVLGHTHLQQARIHMQLVSCSTRSTITLAPLSPLELRCLHTCMPLAQICTVLQIWN